mgnify:CR=1 FL=1
MPNPTACLLIIGNEVLSGRTRDANLQFLATRLGEIGIPMKEVRVIPDVPEVIINTVNEVRAKFDHVFTTGGIGPTHDDITADCIAEAFGQPIYISGPGTSLESLEIKNNLFYGFGDTRRPDSKAKGL